MQAALDKKYPGKDLFGTIQQVVGDDVVKQRALALRILTLGPDEAHNNN
jgi:hypothetical protein